MDKKRGIVIKYKLSIKKAIFQISIHKEAIAHEF